MAISRPFLLALLGVALLGATAFAVQNARTKASDDKVAAVKPSVPAPAPTTPAPAQAASGKLSAKDAVTAVLSPGKSIDSTRFSISYATKEVAGAHEHDYASLTGSYVSKGATSVPDFDVRMKSHDETAPGKGVKNSDVRAIMAGGAAYAGEGAQMYKLPSSDSRGLTALRKTLGASDVAKIPQFQLTRWLRDVKVVGSEKMDGVEATHVTGSVAAGAVAADVMRLARAEAESSGSPDVGVPAGVARSARHLVKKARFDAWVGGDRIVRRMALALTFDAPKALREPGDTARWTANFNVSLNDVNSVDSVEAPSNVSQESAVKGMGRKDANDAHTLLNLAGFAVDAPGGVTGASFTFLRLNRLGSGTKVAKNVLRAVEQHKQVVVFFKNPKALDDRATAESVRYVKSHTKKVLVFSDDVANTRRYGRLLENLGVTQAPAIVFINRRGTASLIEGYVDGPSLAQVIADAK